ncbi:UDP-glycosyltransferase UGT5-like [Arctopsyche grandis]|uniref:UDP-glycosyltransferase UGT5-like n=1 Tax=Arctopsyche grandis TaxID=121162 RepID=UPI00406D7753
MEPIQKSLYEEYFPEESKRLSFNDLTKRISFVLVNSHPSIGIARPLLPNTIEIGDYYIKDPEPLPEDLKTILDSAKEGVVYFSMGSILNSSQMTHSNVKLFISHGGLLSFTEAIHFGVPLLIIPIFCDQNINAKAIEKNEALQNPKYAETAKQLHQLYYDRPMRPRDLLVYYVEYVVRTKGAHHLSPPQLNRCSQLLLDILDIILIPIIIIGILLSYVLWKCCYRKQKQTIEENKKKITQKTQKALNVVLFKTLKRFITTNSIATKPRSEKKGYNG